MIHSPKRASGAILTALLFVVSIVTLVAGAGIAHALPPLGSTVPDARVEDADGSTVSVRQALGRPVLVVYEDKSSATQNAALKEELAQLARGERYRRTVALVAVADLGGYAFWPIKGFVKDAIRSESEKVGTTIYCDWDGAFRNAFGFRRGVSNVVLVGRGGRILFAREGALSAAERKMLFDLLRAEVGPT